YYDISIHTSYVHVCFSPSLLSPSAFLLFFFFFLIIRPPPTSTLFPYTTLFRSIDRGQARLARALETNRVGKLSGTVGTYAQVDRSEEHTSELQSLAYLVCRLLLEKKKKQNKYQTKNKKQSNNELLSTAIPTRKF